MSITNKGWDEKEIQILRDNYLYKYDRDIVNILNYECFSKRTIEEIQTKRTELKLFRLPGGVLDIDKEAPIRKGGVWTNEEIELLRSLYKTHTDSEIVKLIRIKFKVDRPLGSLQAKRKELRLLKAKSNINKKIDVDSSLNEEDDEEFVEGYIDETTTGLYIINQMKIKLRRGNVYGAIALAIINGGLSNLYIANECDIAFRDFIKKYYQESFSVEELRRISRFLQDYYVPERDRTESYF